MYFTQRGRHHLGGVEGGVNLFKQRNGGQDEQKEERRLRGSKVAKLSSVGKGLLMSEKKKRKCWAAEEMTDEQTGWKGAVGRGGCCYC